MPEKVPVGCVPALLAMGAGQVRVSDYDESVASRAAARSTDGGGAMTESVDELRVGGRYRIRLCSGELRCWRFEGREPHGLGWWRDEETGLSFSESGLMYAWQVEGCLEMGTPGAGAADGRGRAPNEAEAGTPRERTELGADPTRGARRG
ncbi:hypothetical protein AAG895_12180 [Thauera sp. JM12B12]|uniref:hypothetical protein n=1 Tax=Thauera sp. JM12B12 TaxID=3142262 RepID=UPI0031F3F57A